MGGGGGAFELIRGNILAHYVNVNLFLIKYTFVIRLATTGKYLLELNTFVW